MSEKRIKLLCGMVAVAMIVMTANEIIQRQSKPITLNDDTATRSRRLRVGIVGSVPSRDEIPVLEEIPWTTAQVNRAYSNAEPRWCQTLPPGIPINPELAPAESKVSGTLGRLSAVSIGLQLDTQASQKLPGVTKSAINSYLTSHRIVIVPTLYHDESGQPYFGADCSAAVVTVENPHESTSAEPMIAESMRRIRTLGVLGGEHDDQGRTLVFAFRYTLADRTGRETKAKFETELFFLQVNTDPESGLHSLSVFATSDGRRLLHELKVAAPGDNELPISVRTMIRFDSMVLMGTYPSQPVVTGVYPNANQELPVEVISRLLTKDSDGFGRTIKSIFSEFASQAVNSSQNAL